MLRLKRAQFVCRRAGDSMWDWGYALSILPALLTGLLTTVIVTVIGTIIGMAGGFVLAMLQTSRAAPLRALVTGYIYIVRGTPFLIQIYLVFYALPAAGIALTPFEAGCVAISLNFSSYYCETFRSGLRSVPRTQWEVSKALGFGPVRTWSSVIIPQMLRPIVPALGNYVNLMFKVSALLAAISVMELFGTALRVSADSFQYLEPMTLTGLLYLIVSIPVSLLVRYLDRRVGAHA